MPSKVYASKVRYCFANEPKDHECYTDVNWNGVSVAANGASANSKYWGMGLKSGGGGPFIVHAHDKPKRFGQDKWCFMGHQGKISDSDFHPFNDSLVLTGSQDCTMKLWQIPEGGLTEHVKTPLVTLEGHSKRVLFCEFHPAAANIVASCAATNQNEMKLWDITTGEELRGFDDERHPKAITDMHWNSDGTYIATASKDKKCRVYDPRSEDIVAEWKAFDSVRPTKLTWINNNTLLTTGFGGASRRECRVFDIRKTEKYVGRTRIDSGSTPLYSVYDPGTNVVLMTAKGSTTVKVFEYLPSSSEVVFCAGAPFKEQCRGFGMLPKRALDVEGVEVMRMMWIGADKVQPLSFKIPRKTRGYIPEFFPDDLIGTPSMTAKEYMSGMNTPAAKGSLDPKKRVDLVASTFVAAKTRKELEAELAAMLATVAGLEKEKAEHLALLEAKGITPAVVDLTQLPPPPPEPVRAAPAPAPVSAPPAPTKTNSTAVAEVADSPPPPAEEKPKVVHRKKKKKKGPLLSFDKPKKEKEVGVSGLAPSYEKEVVATTKKEDAIDGLLDELGDDAAAAPADAAVTEDQAPAPEDRHALIKSINVAMRKMSLEKLAEIRDSVCNV